MTREAKLMAIANYLDNLDWRKFSLVDVSREVLAIAEGREDENQSCRRKSTQAKSV